MRMAETTRMASRLRYAMEMNEITASELARRAGCHKSSISMYLKGEHAASASGAERLACILNVSPAWLLGYDVPITDVENEEARERVRNLNRWKFVQVGDTVINLSHVITIRNLDDGNVAVLLDNGTTIEGRMIE